jgi:hypothetical protein
MSFPMFFLPQFSIANSPQINTYSGPEVRLAEAISVNFSDFLPSALVTDGSVNYTQQVNSAIDDLNAEYLNDGFERMLTFPEGFFRFTGRFLTGTGLRGQGVGKTLFRSPADPIDSVTGTPINRFVVVKRNTNPVSNNLFWDFEVNQDHIPFSWIATYGVPFFGWKCIAWDICTDGLFKSLKCGNTLGTSIGIDWMNRIYCYDVESYNAGRGVTTSGESGPGAGFGITSGSIAAHEVLEFYNCKAWGNKTSGFYFERALVGQFKPTGHKMVNCEAYNNYLGTDNNACENLEIIGGRMHHNSRAGYHHGANRTTNYNQGPKGATLINVDIDNNGKVGTYNSGGVMFGYSINRSPDAVILDNCNVHSNFGNAIGAIGSGLLAPNENLRYGESPRILRLINGTKIHNNAGGAIVLTNPRDNQVNATTITSSTDAILSELTIDNTVLIQNNNRAIPRCEVADAIQIGMNATNINISGEFVRGDAQEHAIALRGNFTTQNLTVSGDLTKQSNYSPIVVEHTVNISNITASLDTNRPTSLLVTNLFTNPKLVTGVLPTLTAGTASNITQAQPIAGLTENYRITATGATVTVDMNALVASGLTYGERFIFSFYAKTSKTTPLRVEFDQSPHTAGVCKQPDLSINTTWTRYSFQGTYITGVDLKMVFSGLAANDTIDLQGLMLLDATIQPSYFDGTVNGGVWGGTENASASSKTVSV